MNQTLTYRTKVTSPSAAQNVPSRYEWLSLDLAEPNLGLPQGTATFFLTGDNTGSRGWTSGLPFLVLDNLLANSVKTTTLSAVSAHINFLTVSDLFSSWAYTNVFDVSSNNPAVRITQRGSGPVLLVEDEANPESTPFTITNRGTFVIGTTAAEFLDSVQYITLADENPAEPRGNIRIYRYGDGPGSNIRIGRRGGTMANALSTNPTLVLGAYGFTAWDGTDIPKLYPGGAYTQESFPCSIQGAIDTNNLTVPISTYPGKLNFIVFQGGDTSLGDTIAMTINSFGNVGIGTTTPNELLTVNGNISAKNIYADLIFTNQLSALSATVDIININQYELSGFNVTGSVGISGDVFVTGQGRFDSIYTNSLTALSALIFNLSSFNASFQNLSSDVINVTDLYVKNVRLRDTEVLNLTANKIFADAIELKSLVVSPTGIFNFLYATTLTAVSADIADIRSDFISTYQLSAFSGYITTLTAVSADIADIRSDFIQTDYLKATSSDILNLYVTNLTALSATINVVDITQYELSGFNITGNMSISGNAQISGTTTTSAINTNIGNITILRSTTGFFDNVNTDRTTSNYVNVVDTINSDNANFVNTISRNISTTNLSAVYLTAGYIDSFNIVSNFGDIPAFTSQGITVVTPSTATDGFIIVESLSALKIYVNNLSGSSAIIDSLTANNLTIGGGDFGQVIIDNLSAFGNPVYINQIFTNSITAINAIATFLSGVEARFDTLCARRMVIGQNSFLTPAAADDSYIIGDNITGSLSGYLFVRNLSAVGTVISRNINNLSIGLGAGEQQSNLAIGVSALNLNSTGQGNIAIGRNALANTTTGLFSVSVVDPGQGYQFAPTVFVSGGGFFSWDQPTITATVSAILSGIIVPTISAVPFFSLSALTANADYSSQYQAITTITFRVPEIIVLGRGAGYYNTPTLIISGGYTSLSATLQTIIPVSAKPIVVTASNNIAIGFNAGATVSTGEDNILIGTNAGSVVTIGERNTVVGNYNILFSTSNNNIVIGYDNYVGGFNNTIIIGNNLSATKSNFAFISALSLDRLEVKSANFSDFLNVEPGGISATKMYVADFEASSAKIGYFDGEVSLFQISQSNALTGQYAYYDGNGWVPSYVIDGFPGTRLFDFQLTALDTGFNVITADTTYSGVAPVIDNEVPATSAFLWRITKVIYNDGGEPVFTGVAPNSQWSTRYTNTYVAVNN